MPAHVPSPATHTSAYLLDALASMKRTVNGIQSRLRCLETRDSSPKRLGSERRTLFSRPTQSGCVAGEPRLTLDPSVREFEGLDAIPFLVEGVRVTASRPDLEALKTEVIEGVRR